MSNRIFASKRGHEGDEIFIRVVVDGMPDYNEDCTCVEAQTLFVLKPSGATGSS